MHENKKKQAALAIVTLTSDYGEGSYYSGSLKGALMRAIPDVTIIDLWHSATPFDVNQASFMLSMVYSNFPVGTWHLLAIDTSPVSNKQILVVEQEGHYFIGADNGQFSLIFPQLPTKVYKVLIKPGMEFHTFPEKALFIPVIAQHLRTGQLKGIAEPGVVQNLRKPVKPYVEGNLLKGMVMLIDSFNNAVTNITKEDFETFTNGNSFRLLYWRKDSIDFVSKNYHREKDGEVLMLFNENGYLEIAMSKTRGAQLLGLKPGSMILIEQKEN